VLILTFDEFHRPIAAKYPKGKIVLTRPRLVKNEKLSWCNFLM